MTDLRRLVATRVERLAVRRSRRPPACPPGWVTGPPDFVGLGVQKAGTTWWYDAIRDHPGVAHVPGRPKEVHFFDEGHRRVPTPDDRRRYESYFPRPPGQLTGEWTPRYLPDFWAHERLRLLAPGTRLLVLLRDPVERYRSGLAHDVGHGERERPGLALEAMYRGLYHVQLAALLRHVPREQVLVLQYERCLLDAPAQLARTYRFLGLGDVDHVPADLGARVNPTTAPRRPLSPAVLAGLSALYEPDVLALTREVPDLDLTLWPSVRHLA